MTRKQAFEHKMGEAFAYLRNPALVSIGDHIGWGLEQLGFGGRDSDIAVKLALADPVDAFRSLRLLVDQMGSSTTAESAGAGMQSALVIAVLRAYAEIKREGAVIAIENPEIFLHPRQVAYFRDAVRSLSSMHQVLIVTHSPEFVDISRPEEIHLVRRSGETGTNITTCGPDRFDGEFKSALAWFNFANSEQSRMFFARGAVLVADAVDKLAVSLTARSLAADLDRAGIEVIACGGKGNLLRYAELAAAFKIPAVVITPSGLSGNEGTLQSDPPSPGKTTDPASRQWNEDLRQGIKEGNLFWLHPNWAVMAGLQTDGPDLYKATAGYFQSHPARDLPTVLVQAVGRICWLIRHERSDRGEE